MREFYWKIAKSFKVLAILSLVGGIAYGLVNMLLSFLSENSAIILLSLLDFILCIFVSIIGSAPLYVLGEIVDRIDRVKNFVYKIKTNVTDPKNINWVINKTSINETSYSHEELLKMDLASLKSLYKYGEISQRTYKGIKSEKKSAK